VQSASGDRRKNNGWSDMTWGRRTASALVALLGLLTAQGALAGTRVALIIGNGAYEHAPLLRNPAQDARDVAATFRDLNYSVQLVTDAKKPVMEAALQQFAAAVLGADQAVVYYSGHGIEVGGINYLLPVDARIESESTVPLQAVSLATVMGIASGARQLGLVVLDACRENPLANNMKRADSNKGATRGLARVEATGKLLVAYATKEGQVASDGNGPHSPYTTAILDALHVQGLEVRVFWGRVHDRVLYATGGSQEPATYGTLGEEALYLNPAPAPANSSRALPQPGLGYDPRSAELALWESAQSIGTVEAYRDYLAKFPTGEFSQQAKLHIDALTRPAAGNSPSPAPPGTPKLRPPSLAALSPGTVFQDCTDCLEMVRVPPGSFQMGSPAFENGRYANEGAVHTVTLRYPLAVSKYPVTRGQWRQYLESTGREGSNHCNGFNQTTARQEQKPEYSWRNPGFEQQDDHPVVCVTFGETLGYAAWLSGKTGQKYRLLSEAEYEYVNRAGGSGAYFWGNDPQAGCRYANMRDGSLKNRFFRVIDIVRCDDGYVFTSPVGRFEPNPFGLYDTTGNVLSWTVDCYHSSYLGAPTDGSAWTSGGDCSAHVVRGGSWFNPPRDLRAAFRAHASTADNDAGFRLARTE
jgi:formylglycine-generating enzyme required for sulfatase activity